MVGSVGFDLKLLTLISLTATTVVAQGTAADLQKIYEARLPFIVAGVSAYGQNTLIGWMNGMASTGKFANVDYTAGCDGRRANWPAGTHWTQLRTIASAYKDLTPRSSSFTQQPPRQFAGNATVKNYLNKGMNWWFNNDFDEPSCLDAGGVSGSNCPCGTPGMWNLNWYANIIAIPQFSGHVCMLLANELTAAQRQSFITISQRAYDGYDTGFKAIRYITGANALDMASNGIDLGLVKFIGGVAGGENNVAVSYQRAHRDLVIHPEVKADGIRPDGSFGQHEGILYNGNYGGGYTSLVLQLEIAAIGTPYAAGSTSKNAFATHVDGFQWMIFKNIETQKLHWDFSVVGRMITFPVADYQSTESIKLNLDDLLQLGQAWNSAPIINAANNLKENSATANAGDLVGTRMFFSNDYIVNRGKNYVTTVKMLSSRTTNSECVNTQNPFGFHLGQGASFTYVRGTEYQDISAAWDWHLIPGITTDYAATPLNCAQTEATGVQTFAGGAVDGKGLGIAAMKYTNPLTRRLSYQKAWFFFEDDIQHVVVSGVAGTAAGRDTYSVLDQKRLTGAVYVNGAVVSGSGMKNYTGTINTLWHDGIGYAFGNTDGANSAPALTVNIANGKTGDWSNIGVSAQPDVTVNLFSAWIKHNPAQLSNPVEYSIYPGVSTFQAFQAKATNRAVGSIRNDADVAAVVDGEKKVVMFAFWKGGIGDVVIPFSEFEGGQTGSLAVATDKPLVLILDLESNKLSVADPSQSLTKATIFINKRGDGNVSWLNIKWDGRKVDSKRVEVTFPQGGEAGKSVVVDLGAKTCTQRQRLTKRLADHPLKRHGGKYHHRIIGHHQS